MNRVREFMDTVASLLGRRRLEAELDEELQYHLDRETNKLIDAGVPADAARSRALASFGGMAAVRDQVREARGLGAGWAALGQSLRSDFVQAARGLSRSRRFSLTVIGLLGVTLGVGTALFSIVDQLLLRPYPYIREPEQVVRLVGRAMPANRAPYIAIARSWVDFEVLRANATATTDHAAWSSTRMSMGRGAEARSILVSRVTPSLFPLLGVRPALGRFFADEEDVRYAASGPAVIGHQLWQSSFGGRADVLGLPVVIGSITYTIVGVAPPGFGGLQLAPVDAWLPIQIAAGDTEGHSPELWSTDGSHWLSVAARLRPGTTRAQAAEDATRAYRTFTTRSRDPDLQGVMLADPLLSTRGSQPGRNASVAGWLGYGVIGLVLLVVANLVNLFLARNLSRGRETAIRLALGGSRFRIFQFLVVESLVLALIAGAIAMLMVAWLGGLVRATLLPTITWPGAVLDVRVALAGFAVATAIGTVVAAGMAMQVGKLQPIEAFRGGGTHQVAGGRGGRRTRLLLVGVQAALSTLLLAASLGFVQSLRRAMGVDLGMEISSVIVAEAPLGSVGYTRQAQWEFYLQLHEQMKATPGVLNVSLGYTVPWQNNRDERIRLPGRDSVPQAPIFGLPLFDAVTPEYLPTMGMQMVSGRWVGEGDREGAPPVVVINQALAQLYWPDRSPLGECMYIGADSLPCRTVVGVAKNHRFAGPLDGTPIAAYFLPLAQSRPYYFVPRLFIRTVGDPRTMLEGVRRAMQDAANDLPAVSVRTMTSVLEPNFAATRLGAYAFSGFGILATVVAMAGLFGVLAYLVAARSSELAIRAALGAEPRQLAIPVVVQGLLVVLGGILAGLGAATYLARWLDPLFFQTRLIDPLVLTMISGLLLLVAAVASLGPARRAGRKDPMDLLRS